MWRPFARKPRPDWRWTGAERWAVIKRQGDYVLEQKQREAVDMNGVHDDRRWFAVEVPLVPPPVERVRKLEEHERWMGES